MDIVAKVERRERLTEREALKLYDLDLFTLGRLADGIRKEKKFWEKRSFFNINRTF